MSNSEKKLVDSAGKEFERPRKLSQRFAATSMYVRGALVTLAAVVAAIAAFVSNLDRLGLGWTSKRGSSPERIESELSVSAIRAGQNCSYELFRFTDGVEIFDGRVQFNCDGIPENVVLNANLSRKGVAIGNLLQRGDDELPYGYTYGQSAGIEKRSHLGPADASLPEIVVNADMCWFQPDPEVVMEYMSPAASLSGAEDWPEEVSFGAEAFGRHFGSLKELRDATGRFRRTLNNELFLFLPLVEMSTEQVPLALDRKWELPRSYPELEVVLTNSTEKQVVVSGVGFEVIKGIAFKSVTNSGVLTPVAKIEIPVAIEAGEYIAERFPILKIAAHDSVSLEVGFRPETVGNSDEIRYSNAVVGRIVFKTNANPVYTDLMIVYLEM